MTVKFWNLLILYSVYIADTHWTVTLATSVIRNIQNMLNVVSSLWFQGGMNRLYSMLNRIKTQTLSN